MSGWKIANKVTFSNTTEHRKTGKAVHSTRKSFTTHILTGLQKVDTQEMV